jgi:hypothetical protein
VGLSFRIHGLPLGVCASHFEELVSHIYLSMW